MKWGALLLVVGIGSAAVTLVVTTGLAFALMEYSQQKHSGDVLAAKIARALKASPSTAPTSPGPGASPSPAPSATPKVAGAATGPAPEIPYMKTVTDTVCTSKSKQSPFVQTCGNGLVLLGRPFVIHGATAYGQYDKPAEQVALARQARLNVIEIVEYETRYHDLSDTMSEATWARIDRMIAAARAGGLHVILNLSSYGHSLRDAGYKPSTTDWGPFLGFVANRVNTQTGVQYKSDSTIALVELYGEIDAPNYNARGRGTTSEVTAFYKRTLAQWRALDPNHLVASGGFSYLDDPRSGIDWRTIMADPNNQVCAAEINSAGDRNITIPNVSAYCHKLGKPMFLAAWSSCLGDKKYPGDINWWNSDAAMAAHAQDIYSLVRNTYPAKAGASFWNLGATPARVGSCDIGPQFPQTFSVVQANAPR
jgi:hypothetical protein